MPEEIPAETGGVDMTAEAQPDDVSPAEELQAALDAEKINFCGWPQSTIITEKEALRSARPSMTIFVRTRSHGFCPSMTIYRAP